jgi:hypothetical protein
VISETKTLQKTCRLLYFGPEESGKRANIRYIHKSLPPEQLFRVESDDPERNIGFRVHHGGQGEWQVTIQALDLGAETVSASPGTDPPFDGVVFVVDSSLAALDQGLAALEALKAYLDQWGLDVMGLPVVLQYNGRDGVDIMPVDQMESLLNPWGLLSYPASVATGDGVRETLKAILGLTIKELVENPRRERAGDFAVAPPAADPKDPSQLGGGGMPEIGDLGIDYGPPLPGTEIAEFTKARGNEIFHRLNPPVVVPVKIPRRLLEGRSDVKILLEVEVTDDSVI